MSEPGPSIDTEEDVENDADTGHAAADENVLYPEEVDPLEVLETIESSLRRVVRGARGKVLRNADPEQATWIEDKAGERPLTAASVAMASGFALGLVVRRVIPRRFR